MLSKSQKKLIGSLRYKKYRDTAGLFVAEGPKVIKELYDSGFSLHKVYTTSPFMDIADTKMQIISAKTLKSVSFLKTPNKALALFEIPKSKKPLAEGIILGLDDIRDPGNLGTIIRLCDWFGIEHLICSLQTTDCYNPKVVQASMGSLGRVNTVYTDLNVFIKNSELPVFGATMEGENIYQKQLPDSGILIMGNEAQGLSSEIKALVTQKISIPQFGKNQETESLNVATATAILLSEFKRPTESKNL